MTSWILLGAALAAAGQNPVQQQAVAFVDVNIIPMDRQHIVNSQTVVIENGRITAVGPTSTTRVPAGATRVDARGKYLIPGLAEMHGHIPASGALTPEIAMFLYIAGGATTVRGMQGHPSHLPLRDRIRSGELVGPTLYLSAPPLSGQNTPDVATAVQRVRDARQAGYDHLKVHEALTQEVYDAIVATARETGLPWGGHVSAHVGVKGALAARQSTIDHLDDYVEALEADNAPTKSSLSKLPQVLDHLDLSKLPAVVRATREAGVAMVPTMPLWEVLRGMHSAESMNDRPELRYVPAQMRTNWANTVTNVHASAPRDYVQREVALRNRILKELYDGGVLILLGSDAPQLYSVPGFSLQREMETMVSAGMTPYAVLESGSVNVAKFYGIENEVGRIAVGQRADLILLDANPLENIQNVAKKAGVMVRGRWLPWSEIQARLDQIAESYR